MKRALVIILSAALAVILPLRSAASQSAKQPAADHCAKKETTADNTGTTTGDKGAVDKRAAGNSPKALSVPDVTVFDQDGRQLRFYTDLVKNKVVVINFIFTTCTTICPPLAATFARVQTLAGDRSGRDFHLISISVDPVTDTPERLKAWAAKFKARPGWTLVTGAKTDIDNLLRALGTYTAAKEDHTPMTIVANDAKGVWTRAYGLAAPAKLLEAIDEVTESK